MPRNGNGEYDLPAGNPVVPGTVIESEWANNTMNDLAVALTDSLTADGQTTPVSNLPMGGYHHTGVSDPTLRNQYATLGMSQDGRNTRVQITGGVNNLTGTLVGGVTNYVAGALVSFFAPATNTGPMTLSYNGIAAASIVDADGVPLAAGAIVAGNFYMALYNGSSFVLVSATATANANTYQASTTGWLRPVGGQYPALTIATGTTINVPAGSGFIIPPGDKGAENAIEVSWQAQSITLSYLASAFSTTITVDATGTIVQYAGRAVGAATRTNAILGIVEHFNGVASNILTVPSVFGDDGYLNRGTASLLTGQIISGGKVTANGVSPLQMDVSGGLIFIPGSSSSTPDNPNTLPLPAQNNIPFKTLAGEATAGVPVLTAAPVTQYDPNGAGVVTTIPANGDVVIHRLYYLYGQYIWVFGQFIYTNITEALNRIEIDRTNRITSTRLAGATLLAEILSTKANTTLSGPNGAIIARGATYFSIGSSGGIGEAPVNGLTYGRKDAAWAQVVAAATPQVTGDLTITNSDPKVIEVMSPVAAGFAGLNAKQLTFDWCNMEITHPDDKTYFRSYNPANGNLRNSTTWDLATGAWTFPGAVAAGAVSGTTGTFSGAVSGTTGTFSGDVNALTFDGFTLANGCAATVQSSPTDNTAGRLLTVGGFGIGGSRSALLPNANVFAGQGIYHCAAGSTNQPPENAGGSDVYCGGDVGFGTQMAVSYVTGNVWTRRCSSGAWTDWQTGMGNGQTWQPVSRNSGVTYTNSTGRPIMIFATQTGGFMKFVSSTGDIGFSPNAVNAAALTSGSFIIPHGASYRIDNSGGTTWTTQVELR